jgi:hypothetical protein
MCWIIISKYKDLINIFENQNDRWLDSVGLLTRESKYKTIQSDFNQYIDYINSLALSPKEWMIFHHREATIWEINIRNAHPFSWNKFNLVQNWTSRIIFEKYKDKYNAEVDSEAILKWLEANCENLKEIPLKLEELKKESNDKIWTLIIVSNGEILFYSDWKSESYVKLDKKNSKKVDYISNYRVWEKRGYVNIGYCILDFDLNILEWNFSAKNLASFFRKCH